MNSNRAVMERTEGKVSGDDDAETAHYRKLSYFPTPPWAARAGAEVIALCEPNPLGELYAWDPAVGRGHMAHGLRGYFAGVSGSDVRDYGAGYPVADFLAFPPGAGTIDWVVTNPPFPLAAEFIEKGLEVALSGVAVLARLALLESVGRYRRMSGLTMLAPFSERVPMQLGSWDPELSTATAYAWFIWAKNRSARPVHIIPPGTKARLTRESDETYADGRKGGEGGRHSRPPLTGTRETINSPDRMLLSGIHPKGEPK